MTLLSITTAAISGARLHWRRDRQSRVNPPASRLCWLLIAGLGVLPDTGSADEWQNLLTNSPFGAAAKLDSAAPSALEFRGFVQEGDVRFFNLYDPAKQAARWVAIDDATPGLKVENFDADKQQLVVTVGGQRLTLPLKQAAVTLVAASAPPPEAATNGNFAVTPDEKSNLQKIAEEIRRRRALRAQTESPAPVEKAAEE